MLNIIQVTFRKIVLDRIFYALVSSALLFLFIPVISTFSMQQGMELSISLSLSLYAIILFMLSVFLGGTSIWTDIERRYTFSVLSLPISRNRYVVGKFLGVSVFLLMVAIILAVAVVGEVWLFTRLYPTGKVVPFGNILLALFFLFLKYVLLAACTFLFSSFSTSFFLPIFGAISIWLAGGAMQQVHDYVLSPQASAISPAVRLAGSILYYLLPNFTVFDLETNAVYGLPVEPSGALLTIGYFLLYASILITMTCIIFSKRELK